MPVTPSSAVPPLPDVQSTLGHGNIAVTGGYAQVLCRSKSRVAGSTASPLSYWQLVTDRTSALSFREKRNVTGARAGVVL
jgi:hypothetical protein